MALDTRVRGNEESGAEGVELLLRKKKKNIRRKAHQRYECREVRVKRVGHVQTEEEEGILGNMMLKRGGGGGVNKCGSTRVRGVFSPNKSFMKANGDEEQKLDMWVCSCFH